MRLSRWNILLFALAGAVGIVLLMGIPLPDAGRGGVDPRTGRRILTAWDRLERARRDGDARIALSNLRDIRRIESSELVERAIVALEAELSVPPKADAVAARRLLELGQDVPKLVAALRRLMHDTEVAAATERFFAPLDADPSRFLGGDGPDGLARALSRRLRSSGEPPALSAFVSVVDRFTRAGRTRARQRWLLRGLAAWPRSAQLRDRLVATYLANHAVEAAAAVQFAVPSERADDAAYLERTVELARWIAAPRREADALEKLARLRDERADHERLLELYALLGEPSKGVAHALYLAKSVGDLALRERAALLAIEDGQVESGLDMLVSMTDQAADAVRWYERIARIAERNFAFDRAIESLQAGRRLAPDDAAVAAHLEALLRRLDRPESLATLLEARISRAPGDLKVLRGLHELVSLLLGLGHEDRARRLLARVVAAKRDPRAFFAALPDLDAAGARGLARYAAQAAAGVDAGMLAGIVQRLRPLLDHAEFRDVAWRLVRRFPDEPIAIALERELIDWLEDPRERARCAGRLARRRSEDEALIRFWIDRASWAGDSVAEREARNALLRLAPDDSDNFDRLVQAMFASGDPERALELVRAHVSRPGVTVDQQLRGAEVLFRESRLTAARVFYAAALEREPRNAIALLRLGQIDSWSKNPASAVGFLERRLAVTDADRPRVEFYLGEALYSVGRGREANPHFESALARMRAVGEPTSEQRSMIARMLVRLGHVREALPILSELVRAEPRNAELELDYADALRVVADLDSARVRVAGVLERRPGHERALRLAAAIERDAHDFVEAARFLERALSLHGADAELLAELGAAHEQVGEWFDARAAYRRWRTLQPASFDAGASAWRLESDLAAVLAPRFEYRWAGAHDWVSEARLYAARLVDRDRTRISFALGRARFAGRAAMVAGGQRTVTAHATLFDAALHRRVGERGVFGLGVAAFPGVPGNAPVAGWASFRWDLPGAQAALAARIDVNALLTDPAALPALGGRRHGVELDAYQALGERIFAGVQLAARRLFLDPDAGARVSSTQIGAGVSLGYRFVRGDVATAGRLLPDRPPGVSAAPFLDREPEPARQTQVLGWIALESQALASGRGLADLVPIAARADSASLVGSLDRHMAAGLGVGAEAGIGVGLRGEGSVWHVAVAGTWRPAPSTEFTLGAGLGNSIAQTGLSGEVGRLWLQCVLRW